MENNKREGAFEIMKSSLGINISKRKLKEKNQ